METETIKQEPVKRSFVVVNNTVIGVVTYRQSVLGEGYVYQPWTAGSNCSRKYFATPEAALKGRVKNARLIAGKDLNEVITLVKAQEAQRELDKVARELSTNQADDAMKG